MSNPLLKIIEIKHGDRIVFGRHTDPSPIKCRSCGWQGRRMDAYHTYKPDSDQDVEPVDKCPKCNEEI